MVDVDDLSLIAPQEIIAENLHVAREHDDVRFGVVDDFEQPRFGRGLGVGRHRHVKERDTMPLG